MVLRQSGIVATTLPLLQLVTTVTNTQSTLPSDLRVVPSVRSSREQVQREVPISSVGAVTTGTFPATVAPWESNQSRCRHGKASPIDEFTGEDSRITFNEWLPILERAANWNGWTQDELLMQLAGYLRGRALQEWKLLDPKDKASYHSTITALRERLDPGNQH